MLGLSRSSVTLIGLLLSLVGEGGAQCVPTPVVIDDLQTREFSILNTALTAETLAISNLESREFSVLNTAFTTETLVVQDLSSRVFSVFNTPFSSQSLVIDDVQSRSFSVFLNADADCNANGVADSIDVTSGTSPDIDGDGVPDECEFLRGDGNGDGSVDIADVVYDLDYLFLGGPGDCLLAMDYNANGSVSISDPAYLVLYLFDCGLAPLAPFPECGTGAEALGLVCSLAGVCP